MFRGVNQLTVLTLLARKALVGTLHIIQDKRSRARPDMAGTTESSGEREGEGLFIDRKVA